MEKGIKLRINGKPYEMRVPVERLLVDLLREDLGLRGTKLACAEGECGACTVLVNGKAANSCLILAVSVNRCEVTTIEGLEREGGLHPLQEAFIEHGAAQCGFCTPGMILAAKGLPDKNPRPREDEIKQALAGNLCRCTGYAPIIRAVHYAPQSMRPLRT